MEILLEIPILQELFLRHNFRWSYDQKKHIKTDFIISNHDLLNILTGKQYFKEYQINYFTSKDNFDDIILFWLQSGGGYTREILEVFGELILLLKECEKKEFYELASNINYILHRIGNAIKEEKEIKERFEDYRSCFDNLDLKRHDFEDFDLDNLPF